MNKIDPMKLRRAFSMAHRVANGYTLKHVGAIYGVSPERVRQICGWLSRVIQSLGYGSKKVDTVCVWLRANKAEVTRAMNEMLD